ncbi:protein of unknown function DUF327 [Desulfofarcimen acetoxidans DSM 771]|uniref:DUF327 domain-containing protein n=1 Tax=Desulfofarcimen acetoxidans (strain ATCC 49208 / DSM 771 / KCTC 5769 / VKM B-1644 / 5575) TaxID=485916 RepID=C8VZT6_DESAS|nr:YaaR family protein [Desulfofarcimen acetoxidans]ACV63064.1 protein of unknown function DUF327 [Desulfofarcimen acetoxidans DSM 771]
MRISTHKRNMKTVNSSTVIKKNNVGSFSSSMDMEKREHREQKLNKLLEKIKEVGKILKDSKSLSNIADYKKYIKEYLSYILENYYVLKFTERYRQILISVDIINKEVEELTRNLLLEQKSNIDMISKIDRIEGLLIDLYR